MFKRLADVRQFAEPLLRQALKVRFGIDIDVTRTFLRLYVPEGILVGYRVKTLSLLDAALHNFETKEKVLGYFDIASCFISEPDASGQFERLAINRRLSVSAFVLTCRELDIGGQYSRQLEELLLPTDAMVKAVLELYVKTSQKDAFRAAVLLARMKGDIGADSQAALLQLLDGGARPVLRGRILQSHHLHMMDAKLIGIMLLAADLGRASSVDPVGLGLASFGAGVGAAAKGAGKVAGAFKSGLSGNANRAAREMAGGLSGRPIRAGSSRAAARAESATQAAEASSARWTYRTYAGVRNVPGFETLDDVSRAKFFRFKDAIKDEGMVPGEAAAQLGGHTYYNEMIPFKSPNPRQLLDPGFFNETGYAEIRLNGGTRLFFYVNKDTRTATMFKFGHTLRGS